MHPGAETARTAQVGLEVLEFLEQHKDVFAARGEICRACCAFGSQLLKLGD
jgi:hypothetical protein